VTDPSSIAPQPVGYTIAQTARIVGVTRRQLEYWAETGLIAPSVVKPGGKRKLYSFFDLVELRTLGRLRAEGDVTLQRMRKVIAELEKVRDRPLATCRLVAADGNVFMVDDSDGETILVEVLNRWQLVTCVSLLGLEYEVRREMGRIGLPAPPPILDRGRVAS
jgi:DNA-binding transcriptional MerR regulator